MIPSEDIKVFLDEKVNQYKQSAFIEEDPIQVPLSFSSAQDQEIAGLLAATIAWGNRKSIIADAQKMLLLMDEAPYDFVTNFRESDLPAEDGSIHRTFMYEDFRYFMRQLQRLYSMNNSLEKYFLPEENEINMMGSIERFRNVFLAEDHRAAKHVSSPVRNSSAKRLNMFLRWMVRDDNIDLGLWTQICPSMLSIPLDIHTSTIARKLGLLYRKQNDRKAVEELDQALRLLNHDDPVRYDFALFGLGVYENF